MHCSSPPTPALQSLKTPHEEPPAKLLKGEAGGTRGLLGGWEAWVRSGRGPGLTCTPVPAGVAEQVRLPVPPGPGSRAAADSGGAVQGCRRHAALWGPGGHRSARSVLWGWLQTHSRSLVAPSSLPAGCGVRGGAGLPRIPASGSPSWSPSAPPGVGMAEARCASRTQAPSPLDGRSSNSAQGPSGQPVLPKTLAFQEARSQGFT